MKPVTMVRPTTLAALALMAVLAARPAAGEDAAPAAAPEAPHHGGGDAAGAAPDQTGPARAPSAGDAPAPPDRDIAVLAPPRHGAALLPWHRASIKAVPGLVSPARPTPPWRPAAATPRNAVGLPLPPRPQGGVAAGGGVTAGVVMPAIRPVPVPVPPAPARPRPWAINGTAMGRAPATPAAIGGPARDRSGINGTLVKPRS